MLGIHKDQQLVEDILAGGGRRQQAIATIYQDRQLKNQVLAHVKSNKGNSDDALDIFHEGIIAMDQSIRAGKFRGESALAGYLFSICKYLWLNKLRKLQRVTYTAEESVLDQVASQDPEKLSMAKEQKEVLQQLLSRIGDKCRQILELWRLSYSMEEIAEQVGLDNAGIARRQRYNCYQKLIAIVDAEPHLRNFLKH